MYVVLNQINCHVKRIYLREDTIIFSYIYCINIYIYFIFIVKSDLNASDFTISTTSLPLSK